MKFLSPLVFIPALSLTPLATAASLPPVADRKIDFTKDIQPIFEAKCIKCHGEEKQKGGYRLDQKDSALTGGDEHAPNIHPGKSAESPLIQFVAGLDPDTKMPPKGDKLSPEEIGVLRAWIDQGAQWPESPTVAKTDPLDWWSLKTLQQPSIPDGTARNPIDRFILQKLAEKGMSPAPEADPRTLIRRITYDLTGLPPTPEETAEFEKAAAQDKEKALEQLAERLLASPRYGERWARHWLDIVHYGDTHGYDKDKPRPNAWPYRDYVIRSLNSDKPYARFIQEQIAGDVLFPGTEDGWAAPGFIAAGPWDYVGHAEVPESKTDGKIARLLDRDDMVANTMNTFCATTVQCARCHNHKFDPIKQEDYYRLQAVFAALDRADKPFDPDPQIAATRQQLENEKWRLEDERQRLNNQRTAQEEVRIGLLEKKIEELKEGRSAVERPEFGYHSQIESQQDVTKWVQLDLGSIQSFKQIRYVACHDWYNRIGPGFGFPVRYKIELSNDPSFKVGVKVLENHLDADVPNPECRPNIIQATERGRYIRFTATKLAPRKNDYIFALAELEVLDTKGRNLALGVTVTSLDSIEVATRWGRRNLVDGYFYGPRTAPDATAIAALEQERNALRAKEDKDPAAVSQQISDNEAATAKLAADLRKLPPPQMAYVGTIHRGTGTFKGTGASGGKPRPIFVLKRGDVRQPLQEVLPGTVSFFKELPAQFEIPADQPEGQRRAALASWVSDKRNPLTWRTITNRVWQYHFGRAICDSPSDFGKMGRLPTHPELLDWLAAEFRDGNQSLKELHKLIVTSATYRQSSVGNPENEKLDANNTLLWRMNRRKLEAEAVRDTVLAVSGKLDLQMGGPGYQDFVIDKPQHSPHYEYEWSDVEDSKTHRRSIYRFIVRSQPQPFMAVLDCADPSMAVEKRNETVNALQALAMVNNRLIVAMAKHFAHRLESLSPEPEARLTAAYQLAFNRQPSALEKQQLLEFTQKHGLPNTCRLLLNLNEFSFVD
ncbi:MAG: DUF1553 domain-containing protein [Verrucomicrobiota bacterium]